MFEELLPSLPEEEPLPYDLLVEKTEGFSGSDIRLLCKEAAMQPLRRLMAKLEEKEEVVPEDGMPYFIHYLVGLDGVIIICRDIRGSVFLDCYCGNWVYAYYIIALFSISSYQVTRLFVNSATCILLVYIDILIMTMSVNVSSNKFRF